MWRFNSSTPTPSWNVDWVGVGVGVGRARGVEIWKWKTERERIISVFPFGDSVEKKLDKRLRKVYSVGVVSEVISISSNLLGLLEMEMPESTRGYTEAGFGGIGW